MSTVSETVSASLVALVCSVGEQQHGLSRSQLLEAAGLTDRELEDPDALLPQAQLFAVMRCVLERSGDVALGLKIARAFDLRTQGLWGYAVLSSTSMRERLDRYARYQNERFPTELAVTRQGDKLVFDVLTRGVPEDLVPVLLDFGFARACANHRKHHDDYFRDHALFIARVFADRPSGFIDAVEDAMMRSACGIGLRECTGSLLFDSQPAALFRSELLEYRKRLAPFPSYGTFLPEGTRHTWLKDPAFYTGRAGTVTLVEWFAKIANGQPPGHAGP
jgi:hypothetical protein